MEEILLMEKIRCYHMYMQTCLLVMTIDYVANSLCMLICVCVYIYIYVY